MSDEIIMQAIDSITESRLLIGSFLMSQGDKVSMTTRDEWRLVWENLAVSRGLLAGLKNSGWASADDLRENFIARYLASSGKKISECQLVQQSDINNGQTRYWIEPIPFDPKNVPAGWRLVPDEATAENGMKYRLIGECEIEFVERDATIRKIVISWPDVKNLYRQFIRAAPRWRQI